MTQGRDRGNHDSRGPVVRPYAVTSGRTKPSGAAIDMVAIVSAVRSVSVADLDSEQESRLGPEHLRALKSCRVPVAVADLASDLDLPLGVVRVLIADLREHGLVNIRQPTTGGLTDVGILREVADALRRL
jgi:DNA-binding transcriptional ArsR family regulator